MANIPKIKGAKKIAKTEVVPFTRQLASMVGAGMPILSTIQTLAEQCANPEFKKVLIHLNDTIEGGDPLSRGLAAFPTIFDDMYVNMVVAGEQSGEFAGILRRLASIMQATARLKGKVKSAMTYPTVIISIALLLAGDGEVRCGDDAVLELAHEQNSRLLAGKRPLLHRDRLLAREHHHAVLPSAEGYRLGERGVHPRQTSELGRLVDTGDTRRAPVNFL